VNLLVENKTDELCKENSDVILNIKTPKSNKKQEISNQNSSTKKSNTKKSRIEKELAIDTVEGHPFLKINSERRVTRKNIINPLNNSRRKSLTEKLNKSKSDNNGITKILTPNTRKKDKPTKQLNPTESISNPIEISPISVDESQEISQSLEELPLSEDVIESSQDSTFTTISTTSTKNSLKKVLVVVESMPQISSKLANTDTQKLLKDVDFNDDFAMEDKNHDAKDDTDIPQNKTALQDKTALDTENMDTESMVVDLNDSSNDVIFVNDNEVTPIEINTSETCIGTETQEIADADTQPTDNEMLTEMCEENVQQVDAVLQDRNTIDKPQTQQKIVDVNTEDDIAKTSSSSKIDILEQEEINTASSPLKDEEQRKKDFLDNTLEISPIKTMSPVREKKSPSPETSSDYVVIKLSSPVQSNGEPFEKCDSPEIFTEDKVSPDKRNQSPPREECTVNHNGSPSSSLSLKKNRPQVRSGGRAAQMLGLCVPDRLKSIVSCERSEPDDPKKSSPSNTPARRNLRILYSSSSESADNCEEKEETENFLKFKKSLPTTDCSPSGPILKRKLAEITDDATISPLSKVIFFIVY
jgi:hypothetical protein